MQIVLFDIDGTLIRSGGAGRTALLRALAEEFSIENPDPDVPFSGRTDRAIIADLLAAFQLDDTNGGWQKLRDRYLDHLPKALLDCQGEVLPGVVPGLEHLKRRSDSHLGLLTGNVRAGAQLKLTHYGLWDYFSFGGFCDGEIERDDVARAASRAAAEHAAQPIAPQDVWVIGDSPNDITCARAIGARVLAVATGWHPRKELAAHEPDCLFDDLSQPDAWLAAIDARDD